MVKVLFLCVFRTLSHHFGDLKASARPNKESTLDFSIPFQDVEVTTHLGLKNEVVRRW